MTTESQPFYRRRGVLIAGGILAAGALAIGWYLFAPLIFSKTVIEEFPRAAAAEVPDDMTTGDVEQAMIKAGEVDAEASEPMPAEGAPVAVSTGSFRDADDFHKGSGTATIYQLEDGSHVLRLENLNVTNGPELHVILSPNPDPMSRDEVSEPGYIDLGKLKGNIGDQNYDIPAGVDVNAQMSVVIYCTPFHVIFSVAGLTASG